MSKTKKVGTHRLDLFAPLMFEILNLWEGFKEVVKFIDGAMGFGLMG